MSHQITCFAVPLSKQFPACHAEPVQVQSAPSTSGHTSSILPLCQRCLLELLCGRSADILRNVTSTTASGASWVVTNPHKPISSSSVFGGHPLRGSRRVYSPCATKFTGKPALCSVPVCASSSTSLLPSRQPQSSSLGVRSASRCLLTS